MKQYLINEHNIILIAIKGYDDLYCTSFKEFENDFSKVMYINKLLKQYERTGNLKDRLILNHLITFYNVFREDVATSILFYKIDQRHYGVLKAFLVYLNKMPSVIYGFSEPLKSVDIPLDGNVIEQLRERENTNDEE